MRFNNLHQSWPQLQISVHAIIHATPTNFRRHFQVIKHWLMMIAGEVANCNSFVCNIFRLEVLCKQVENMSSTSKHLNTMKGFSWTMFFRCLETFPVLSVTEPAALNWNSPVPLLMAFSATSCKFSAVRLITACVNGINEISIISGSSCSNTNNWFIVSIGPPDWLLLVHIWVMFWLLCDDISCERLQEAHLPDAVCIWRYITGS